MLILRENLTRPLTWSELDHNAQVLEINEWEKQDYEERQKCFVTDGGCTTIYNCVYSHVAEAYEPSDLFAAIVGGTTVWESIASNCGGTGGTSSYVTDFTYASNGTGGTLTIEQTGFPDVIADLPAFSLVNNYVSTANLTGRTLNLTRAGSLPTLTVDLQPIIDVATGITASNTYLTSGLLTGSYVLFLSKNDGSSVSVDLTPLRDGNSYVTSGVLTGTTLQLSKNSGGDVSPIDLSGLVSLGSSGYSGYSGIATSGYSGASGYSGIDGGAASSGYSGYSGIGTSGRSGYSGYSGYSGSGRSGYSGYSGSGSSGFSGASGMNGTSGYSGFSGYSGNDGSSAFIAINNNVDNRILTANGSTSSIDAEETLTLDDNYFRFAANSPAAHSMISFHNASESITGTDEDGILAALNGCNLVSLRGRAGGGGGEPTAMEKDDIIFRQAGFGLYGIGTSVNSTDLFSTVFKLTTDMNTASPTPKVSYVISTRSDSVAVDSIIERFEIDEDGDTHIRGNLNVNKELILSNVITTGSDVTVGGKFAYLAIIGDNNDMTYQLPQASLAPNAVYYFAVKEKGGPVTGNQVVKAYFGETIMWQANTYDVEDRGWFIMLQSDGISNWFPLSISTTSR